MYADGSNEWGLILSSVADGTRPASAFGTAVTPGSTTYGSYAQLISGANVTDDVCRIVVRVNNVGISGSARDCVVTIGCDPAGGASYTDTIVDLVCGPASPHTPAASITGLGVVFDFPLFIRAGTSIAAKAAVSSVSVADINVRVDLYCRPSNPDRIRVGTYVDTIGTIANQAGVAIVPGGASEGAWTQIGSTLTRPYWYLELGYGINDSTMVNNTIHVDVAIGDASNKKICISNAVILTTAGENIAKPRAGEFGKATVADLLYARAQVGTGAADSANSIALYGVGG